MASKKNMFRPDLVKDEQKFRVAALTFGEATGQSDAVKKMVASSVFNRAAENKKSLGGSDLDSVMNRRNQYYSVSDKDALNKNPFKQAATMQFKNERDAKEFSKLQDLVDDLEANPKRRTPGTYFLKPNEAPALKKNLRKIGRVGEYEAFVEKK